MWQPSTQEQCDAIGREAWELGMAIRRANEEARVTEQELIEQLADKEHASWARWMEYQFSKCEWVSVPGQGGPLFSALRIPPDLVAHWQRQIDTPYADLTEREKESDRAEVAHILPIIQRYAGEIADGAVKWVREHPHDA